MNLQHLQILLLVIIIEISSQNITTNNSTILKRQRRYLIFPKGARNGFRVNFKHNRVVPITAILAYSDGMRLQWDLPTKPSDLAPKFNRRSEQRRDVFELVQQVLNTYGLDGEACVMRALCETANIPNTPATGIVKKILHLIFMQPEHDDKYVQRDHQACQDFIQRCSFSLLGPSYLSPMHELHPLD